MTAVLEFRTYRAIPGMREALLEILRARAFPAQRRLGIRILGPFASAEDDDTFHWVRGFPSARARVELTAAFYDGPEWTDELEPLVMPMLADYRASAAEDSAGLWVRWPREPE